MIERNQANEIHAKNQYLGRLEGFRFIRDPNALIEEAKGLRASAMATLGPKYILRSEQLYNAPDTALTINVEGSIFWETHEIARLEKGANTLAPRLSIFADAEIPLEVREKITRRLTQFLTRHIAIVLDPLCKLLGDENLQGGARGVGFRLVENLGIIARADIAAEIKALDQDARATLRKHGVRFGQFSIFMPALLKPAPTALRLVLWALDKAEDEVPKAPPPGYVTLRISDETREYLLLSGYFPAGTRAIRIDMLERLLDLIRAVDTAQGFEANIDMLSISGLSLVQFADLLKGLGYQVQEGTRLKTKKKSAPISGNVGELAPEDTKTKASQPVAKEEEKKAAEEEETEPEKETFFVFCWQKNYKPTDVKQKSNRNKSKHQKPVSQRKSVASETEMEKLSNPFIDALKGFKAE